jgi:trichothecene 3-O-acetyltransferase
MANIDLPPSTPFVSTDDALTAFIWKSIVRARIPRLHPSKDSKLARAVNVRRHLGVPATYPGLLQNMTYHSFDANDLARASLGHVASDLRAALAEPSCNLKHASRALATYLSRSTAEEKTRVSFTADLDLGADIMLSSWAAVDCASLDFGFGLGPPEAVRRPRFTPVESLVYLLPKARDGEIVVGMCLREEDLRNLRADEDLGKYAIYIG